MHHTNKLTTASTCTPPRKIELHKKPAPIAAPTFDDDEDGGGGRAPRGGWFQKLGTKRSTTGATAAAAAAAAAKAAKKAKQEAAGEGPVEEGVDGKENKGKGEGVGAAAAAKAVVRFKYQAGYTNAVRRPVFLKDML